MDQWGGGSSHPHIFSIFGTGQGSNPQAENPAQRFNQGFKSGPLGPQASVFSWINKRNMTDISTSKGKNIYMYKYG
jgi:hypothetical protein